MADYVYAIIGISVIFFATTLGSLFVFFFKGKEISDRLSRIFIGFAAGVMFSASFFSLIKPALESEVTYMPTWVIASISVALGAGFYGSSINSSRISMQAKAKKKGYLAVAYPKQARCSLPLPSITSRKDYPLALLSAWPWLILVITRF